MACFFSKFLWTFHICSNQYFYMYLFIHAGHCHFQRRFQYQWDQQDTKFFHTIKACLQPIRKMCLVYMYHIPDFKSNMFCCRKGASWLGVLALISAIKEYLMGSDVRFKRHLPLFSSHKINRQCSSNHLKIHFPCSSLQYKGCYTFKNQ